MRILANPAQRVVPDPEYVFVAHSTTPFITAYRWSGGFGTKFANPATLPASTGNGVDVTTANDAVIVAHATSPFVTAYPWSDSGFGTKFANPASLPSGTGQSVSFRPDGTYVAVGFTYTTVPTDPQATAYEWSGSGFGVKVSDPDWGTTVQYGRGATWTPNGNDVAFATAASVYVRAYPFTTGFGTRYTGPAVGSRPTGQGNGAHFSPTNGTNLAIAHDVSPYITVLPWSSGFGTKFANPATLPTGEGSGAQWTLAENVLAVAHTTSPYISVYPWSGGFGTKYSDPASLPAGNGLSVAFSSDDYNIAVAHVTSPFITAYPWDVTVGFGSKYADPANLPAGTGRSVRFSK